MLLILSRKFRSGIGLINSRSLHVTSCLSGQQSYYEELGVHPQASSKEIKAAFYKLSKEFHPDRNVDNPEALRKFQNISEAYDTLSNPGTRTKYDKGVLGRSSSVAEREASKHTFEGEVFYGSRSNRLNTDAGKGKNLDSWVREARKEAFETSQYYNKLGKRKLGGQDSKPRRQSMHDNMLGSTQQNASTDKSISSYLFLLLILLCLVKTVVGA